MKRGIGIAGILAGSIFMFVALAVAVPFILIGSHFRGEAADSQELLNTSKTKYVKVRGIITEAYDGTRVEYEDKDDEEHSLHFNITSSDFHEGDKVEVYYEKKHPSNAIVKEIDIDFNKTFGSIFFFVGIGVAAVFGVIGISIIVSGIVASKCVKDKSNSDDWTNNSSNEKNDLDAFNNYKQPEYTDMDNYNMPVDLENDPMRIIETYGKKGGDYSGIDKDLLK